MDRSGFQRELTSATAQRIALGIALGIAFVLLVQTWGRAYRPVGYDLTSYLASATALWEGGDPYRTGSAFPYVYPLFLAFALIPLALLPYALANLLWFALSAACLLYTAHALIGLAADSLGTSSGRHLAAPGAALLLLFLNPIQNNLLNGQVNLLVLALCTAFLLHRLEGRAVGAAACLGAAIAIKLWPAIFLLSLLVRRELRALFATLGWAALFCLLPGLMVGGRIFALYAGYLDGFVLQELGAGQGSGGRGLFFGPSGLLRFLVPGGWLGLWGTAASALVSLLPVLAFEALLERKRTRAGEAWLFSAYLAAALMIAPRSEVHHLALLAPGAGLAWLSCLFDGAGRRALRAALLAAFFAFLFLGQARPASPAYLVATLLVMVSIGVRAVSGGPPTEPRGSLVAPAAGE